MLDLDFKKVRLEKLEKIKALGWESIILLLLIEKYNCRLSEK